MDYEKKYNEAVCNIQKLLENGRKEGEVICAYEADFMSIFPELKESEDERIKTFIRGLLLPHIADVHLEGDKVVHNKDIDNYRKALAWIEKQGTPAKLSEEEQNRFAKGVLTSCAMSFIDYLDAHKYEGKMCVSNGECEDIENAFHNAMWDRLHRYYGKYIEKQGEQIPANSAKTCKDEQKPAWREEDENHIQHISDFIMRNRVGDTDAIYRLEQDVKWLKSIKDRYAWKPSDEQMQCLYDAIEYYQTNGYPATKLKELHEQMQKIYKL